MPRELGSRTHRAQAIWLQSLCALGQLRSGNSPGGKRRVETGTKIPLGPAVCHLILGIHSYNLTFTLVILISFVSR